MYFGSSIQGDQHPDVKQTTQSVTCVQRQWYMIFFFLELYGIKFHKIITILHFNCS